MKLDDCNQKPEWVQDFREFASKPRGILLFTGRNGTGKTFAAQAIQKDFKPQVVNPFEDPSFFTTQSNLNMTWQKQIKDWGDTLYLANQLIKYPLLILDDLGTRIPSASFMDFLYQVIDTRYVERHFKGTIITTNMNSLDMRRDFGDAIVSRVASGRVYRFEGSDRRMQEF